jgi:hypothetical protein
LVLGAGEAMRRREFITFVAATRCSSAAAASKAPYRFSQQRVTHFVHANGGDVSRWAEPNRL